MNGKAEYVGIDIFKDSGLLIEKEEIILLLYCTDQMHKTLSLLKFHDH